MAIKKILGVFHITEVNFSHEALRSVRRLQKQEEVEEEEEEENIAVVQAFTCNAHVLPLFSKYRKYIFRCKFRVYYFIDYLFILVYLILIYLILVIRLEMSMFLELDTMQCRLQER